MSDTEDVPTKLVREFRELADLIEQYPDWLVRREQCQMLSRIAVRLAATISAHDALLQPEWKKEDQ